MGTRGGMFRALCGWLVLYAGCSASSGTPPAATAASSSGAEQLASAPLTSDQIVKRYSDCWGNLNAKNWDAFSAPTHKAFDLQMLEITRWRDGKVQAIWPMFNAAALGSQLGLTPPPAAKK